MGGTGPLGFLYPVPQNAPDVSAVVQGLLHFGKEEESREG